MADGALAGTARRAAARYGIGEKMVRGAMKRGELPAYRVGATKLLVFFVDVERWIRSMRVDPTAHARWRVEEILEREARKKGTARRGVADGTT